MKVVINRCYGGFGLSNDAVIKLIEMKSKIIETSDLRSWSSNPQLEVYGGYKTIKGYDGIIVIDDKVYSVDRYGNEFRTHPDLIKVVEELGEEKASGQLAELEIIEIPDGIDWYIDEYDGVETIREAHRSWG